MEPSEILEELKKGKFKPFYWLEGDEPYYIDKIIKFAENEILKPNEADFNLSVFYGRDANWADVVNACKQYPVFGNFKIVLLKEAQGMKDLEKLTPYFERPLSSTLLIIGYKDKKLDARTKFAKTVTSKGVLYSSKKVYENQLPPFIRMVAKENGLEITEPAVALMVDHIGNDLLRIGNEIEKLSLNLGKQKKITDTDVATYIGINREFNITELQVAIATRDFAKCIKITQYFSNNNKAYPIEMILPALHGYFSKAYALTSVMNLRENEQAEKIGVMQFFLKDYTNAVKNYGKDGIEQILLLIQAYNMKNLGIDDAGTTDSGLMKELLGKIILMSPRK